MFVNARAKSVLMAATLLLAASVAIGQEQPAAPAQNLPAIIVTTAESRDLVDRVVSTGTLSAEEEVQIQPQVEGLQIKSLNADVGDTVQADAVVAKLSEDTLLLQRSQYLANRAKAEAALAQYQAQLVEAEASLNEAQRQLDRTTRLVASGSVSTSQKEQAETTLASATARVETARQAITVAEADIKVVDTQIADTDSSPRPHRRQVAESPARFPYATPASAPLHPAPASHFSPSSATARSSWWRMSRKPI